MSSGYRVQPDQNPEARLIGELNDLGFTRPVVAGDDPMDESMPSETLHAIVQISLEFLARRGGAQTGDLIRADAVNRGLLAYLHDRLNL